MPGGDGSTPKIVVGRSLNKEKWQKTDPWKKLGISKNGYCQNEVADSQKTSPERNVKGTGKGSPKRNDREYSRGEKEFQPT